MTGELTDAWNDGYFGASTPRCGYPAGWAVLQTQTPCFFFLLHLHLPLSFSCFLLFLYLLLLFFFFSFLLGKIRAVLRSFFTLLSVSVVPLVFVASCLVCRAYYWRDMRADHMLHSTDVVCTSHHESQANRVIHRRDSCIMGAEQAWRSRVAPIPNATILEGKRSSCVDSTLLDDAHDLQGAQCSTSCSWQETAKVSKLGDDWQRSTCRRWEHGLQVNWCPSCP